MERRNPGVVKNISGSGSDPLSYPYTLLGEGKFLVSPKELWDTQEIPILPAAPLNEIEFFQRFTGQVGITVHTTNNLKSGEVHLAKSYVFDEIGISFLTNQDEPFKVQGFNTFIDRLRRSVLQFEVDHKPYFQALVWRYFELASPQPPNSNYPFAPFRLRLNSPLFLRSGVNWTLRFIPLQGGLVLPEQVWTGSINLLQVVLAGREFETVQKP